MVTKLCGEPGCSKLALPGKYFCTEHQKKSDDKKAKHAKDFSSLSKAARAFNYNNPEWRKIKTKVLKIQPYCTYCGSRDNLQVHHIKPVRYYPELMYSESNLMVLCRQCHYAVTQREIKNRIKR